MSRAGATVSEGGVVGDGEISLPLPQHPHFGDVFLDIHREGSPQSNGEDERDF